MQHIIETSNGNRTLIECDTDGSLVTPMIDAFEHDVVSGFPVPGWVAASRIDRIHDDPFQMSSDELTREIARRKAVR